MPRTPRALAASLFASTGAPLALGAAIASAALALQIASHHKPWAPFAPIELSNQLVAATGLAWAALQLREVWRDVAARRAWVAACVAMALIVLEDQLARVAALRPHPALEISITAGFWVAAGAMVVRFGRLYAMRRWVTAAIRGAFSIQLAIHLAALAAILTAPLRAHPHPATIDVMAETGELVAVLGYVLAMLWATFAPAKDYATPVAQIGLKARRIFYDFGLERRPRYPTPYRILRRPVARQVVLLAMALWCLKRGAASAARDGGGSPARQLARIARAAARGIDPYAFYLFGLYRPGAGAEAHAAFSRVETKNGLTFAIQSLDRARGGPWEMSDKLVFWRLCEDAGVASAPILATVDGGGFSALAERAAFDRSLFVKERRGRGGKFTLSYERVAPFLYRGDDGDVLSLSALVDGLCGVASAGRSLIVQPKLENHPEVTGFVRSSLAVFRVVTCLDDAGEPRVTHGALRILRRFEPSWPDEPDEEWDAAIDVSTGALGRLAGDVVDTCGRWREVHPVTGETVVGRRLGCWPAVSGAAVRAHSVFSSRALVGWDVAATPEGPVILEGNANMDFAMIQRCSRTPVGLSPLGPLLDRHLDRLVADRMRADGRDGVPAPLAASQP